MSETTKLSPVFLGALAEFEHHMQREVAREI